MYINTYIYIYMSVYIYMYTNIYILEGGKESFDHKNPFCLQSVFCQYILWLHSLQCSVFCSIKYKSTLRWTALCWGQQTWSFESFSSYQHSKHNRWHFFAFFDIQKTTKNISVICIFIYIQNHSCEHGKHNR